MGKIIHWELCKRLEFDNTTKWYVHKQESFQENDTLKTIWDFELDTDQLIPGRRPDQILINKKKITCHWVDFAVPADRKMKIEESEKLNKYLDLVRELKETQKTTTEEQEDVNC